jgi:serine/threonine protein kinase/WD40 repeat protein
MNTLNVVEAVFLAALDKESPEARAAYLDEACSGDANLRRCVERLLNAHPKAEAFLQGPAPGLGTVDQPPAIAERPGTILGPFKLLQQLGEGGFGVVFLAEQEQPIRRKVALKIIKPGMDSKQVSARFEAERQALAMMDHPSIAKVLDAGTTDSGRPYFVMELVKGVPITEFCDKNRLTPRERLELFVPVCQAVQHAHQKGIIHRDLKPSNVLVALYDDKPVPKVIDFGVAKAIEQKLTEQTLFTRIGQVVGTLEYMSPEQASLNALDVDTRSDVYALGVLLYELLTGTTPLSKERLHGVAFVEMLRMIREEEPPKPSTRLTQPNSGLPLLAAYRKSDSQKLPKLVRGELDWIAMKALDKDRARRYATASALAADLQCYLDDEQVEACPPSLGYRLRKYLRRHKTMVAMTGMAAALLLLGALLSGWQALRATRAEWDALVERDVADQMRALAQANERIAVVNADLAATKEKEAIHQATLARISELAAKKQAEENRRINTQLLDSQFDLRRALYASDMKLIQVAWESDNLGRVRELLHSKVSAPGQKDLRHFEWHYWNRQANGGVQEIDLEGLNEGLPPGSGDSKAPVFSPDGTVLAIMMSEKNAAVVKLWDTATGKVRLACRGPALEAETTAPLPGVMTGHMAFSADGKRLAAQISFRERTALPKPPTKGGFNASGFVLKTELLVWDTVSGKEIWRKQMANGFGPLGTISTFAFHPDGSRVAEWADDPKTQKDIVVVQEVGTGKVLHTFAEPSREGQPMEDATDKFKKGLTVPGSRPPPLRLPVPLRFSPDGTRLLAAWGDGQGPLPASASGQPRPLVVAWDVTTGKEVFRINSPNYQSPSRMIYSADGRRLIVAVARSITDPEQKSALWMHDGETGEVLFRFAESDELIGQPSFSPDGKSVLTTGTKGSLELWDSESGKLQRKLLVSTVPVTAAAFSADSQWLLTVGRVEAKLKIWQATPPGLFTVRGTPIDTPQAASLSADGKRLAVGFVNTPKKEPKTGLRIGSFHVLRVLDTTTGEKLFDIDDPTTAIVQFQLTPDGRHLLVLQRSADDADKSSRHEVVSWEVETGKKVKSAVVPFFLAPTVGPGGFGKKGGGPGGPLSGNFNPTFSPDGKRLAFVHSDAASKQRLAVFEAHTGNTILDRQIIETANGPETPTAVFFSPNGDYLALTTTVPTGPTSYRMRLDLVDQKTGQVYSPNVKIGGPRGAGFHCAFTQDGKRLVVADRGPATRNTPDIVIYDMPTGKVVLYLTGHSAFPSDVIFSPDGQRVASVAHQGANPPEVKVWDAINGQELLTLTGAADAKTSGRTIGPGSENGAIQFSAEGHRLFYLLCNRSQATWSLQVWDGTPLPETE